MHAPTENRTNWALGLRGLLVAVALAGVASVSGSIAPMVAAALVAGWAVVKPLGVGRWALSASTWRGALAVAVRLLAVAMAAMGLSFAINSGTPLLSVPGTLLFIALIGVVVLTALRFLWTRGARLAPRAWASSLEAAGTARSQVAAVVAMVRHG